jgi:hypothetical protein
MPLGAVHPSKILVLTDALETSYALFFCPVIASTHWVLLR